MHYALYIQRSDLDTCLFWKRTGCLLTTLVVYVDDILVAGPLQCSNALSDAPLKSSRQGDVTGAATPLQRKE